MSLSDLKKNAPLHTGFEVAGTVARFRRSGKIARTGRRSALLGILASTYVNASKGGRIGDTRGNGTERA